MAKKTLITKKDALEQLDAHGTEALGGLAKIIEMASGVEGFVMAADAIAVLKDSVDAGKVRTVHGVPIVDNPLFVSHDVEGDSPQTIKYLQSRLIKKIGGGAVSLIGAIGAAAGSQVNVGGIARHGAAEVNTLIHIYKLKQIGAGFKHSAWLNAHLDALIYIKAFKAGVRGAELTADAIPSFGAGTAVSGTIGVLAHGAKIAGATVLDRIVVQIATQLHWRAYQEITVGAAFGGGVGPAFRMLDELFTRRAHRFLGGGYDTRAFVREPAGWLAVQDKLKLI